MGTNLTAGYREQSHTADWALEVWAPDRSSLFVQAAKGMMDLMGVKVSSSAQVRRSLHLNASDLESLLVAFLAELLFYLETERLAFTEFELDLLSNHLDAVLYGGPVLTVDKEIKAVTYHNLTIQQDADGLKTTLVFDV